MDVISNTTIRRFRRVVLYLQKIGQPRHSETRSESSYKKKTSKKILTVFCPFFFATFTRAGYYSWGELKLTFSIMALLKRLISTVSMLQKALIRLTPMLFSIFLQKSQSFTLLIFDFFFLQFGFAMRRLGEKTVGLGRLTERL